ncbi:MAG: DUF1569 domain-containing protein [Planctomycetota bacterium]
MAVNVKQAERRELHFDTLDEVLADAEAVTDSSTATGNWTPPQIIDHVAFGVHMLNHGIDLKIPLPMKLLGRIMKKFGMHTKPMNPGIKPPAKVAAAFAPDPDITLEQAKQKLRDEVAYANEHGMHHPSPLFGQMTPEECIQMNCRHAELHFSFIRPAS